MSSRMSETLSTLQRGMAVFDHLVKSSPMTAKQIASHFGISLGICYHILRTLEADGYVQRNPGGIYGLGTQAYTLGRHLQRHSEIAPELAVILTRLHNVTGETTFIAEWRNSAVFLRHFLTGTQTVNVGGLEVGYTGNMHSRASCKAILANLPTDQVQTLFAGVELEQLTPNTIVDFDALLVELSRVRRQGYATDNEEFLEGMRCLAAPYFDAEGNPSGSFTISTPSERFKRKETHLISQVSEAAKIATTLLKSGRLQFPVSTTEITTTAPPHLKNKETPV